MRPSRLRRSLGATRNKSSQNELVRIAELLDLVDEFLRSGNGVAERARRLPSHPQTRPHQTARPGRTMLELGGKPCCLTRTRSCCL